MIKKLTLLAGLGAGYVLGARAGTERYDQIKKAVADLRGTPKVQHATEALQRTAADVADKAKEAVNEQVDKVVNSTVDLTDAGRGTGAAAPRLI